MNNEFDNIINDEENSENFSQESFEEEIVPVSEDRSPRRIILFQDSPNSRLHTGWRRKKG